MAINNHQSAQKNGKICYIEIPSKDIEKSIAFYTSVFGWNVRKRSDGKIAFDDSTGEVSGSWVKKRDPAAVPGLLVYIMVDSAEETVKLILENGGKIVQPIGGDAPEITARFSDPSGNIIGIYQEPVN